MFSNFFNTVLSVVFCLFLPTTVHLVAQVSDSVRAENDNPFRKESFGYSIDGTPVMSLWGGAATGFREGISQDLEQKFNAGIFLGIGRTWMDSKTSRLADRISGIMVQYSAGIPQEDAVLGNKSSLSVYTVSSMQHEGYGYQFSDNKTGLMFYSGKSTLTFNALDPIYSTPLDGQAIADFGTSLRLGEAIQPSIGLRLWEPVTIRVSSTWAQIYPRTMVWYYFGSQIIEGIADASVSYFVRQIGPTSPSLQPIMHFILRNGVALGFKALRAKQMNWPFTTVAPLNIITYDIGVSINF